MKKSKEMTWEKWLELGDAVKKMQRALEKVDCLMYESFVKTSKPIKRLSRVDESIEKLQIILDDAVGCIDWPGKSDSEVNHIFMSYE